MYAILEACGRQYKVSEGDILFVEKLDYEVGAEVVFDKILALSVEQNLTFGAPVISGASVNATILKHGKEKKIIVFKYKAKKGYRKKQGHRQSYTKIQIQKISV